MKIINTTDLNYIKLYIRILKSFRLRKKYLLEKGINTKIWEKKFLNLLKSKDERCEELLTEFLTCQMKKISQNKVKRISKYAPILFCVIRNEIYKIAHFMKHYRDLGIEIFIFLDNNSNDGTTEFLCQQEDVILYSSEQKYSSARRVAWLNRLLAIYGHNKWCLIVDSDELVTYIGYEKYKLSELIKVAIHNHYYRIVGFMLDMYPKGLLFQNDKESDDYVKHSRYFDTISYKIRGTEREIRITGGPRKRIFGTDMKLSKYPLFYFSDDLFIASSHYTVPFERNNNCPIWIALCHYKFINDDDLFKVKEAVCNENYAGGSLLYKKYLSAIEEIGAVSFYEDNNSCEMKTSVSLKNIHFLRDPFEASKDILQGKIE